MKRKYKKAFDRGNEVRAIARERIGKVKKTRAIESKKSKLDRLACKLYKIIFKEDPDF